MNTVAVVGAGPGGLSAAFALHQAGFGVNLYERRAGVVTDGSGLSLTTPPLLALRALGVDIDDLGASSSVGFSRYDGRPRAEFPAIPELERDFGATFFGMLRPTSTNGCTQRCRRAFCTSTASWSGSNRTTR